MPWTTSFDHDQSIAFRDPILEVLGQEKPLTVSYLNRACTKRNKTNAFSSRKKSKIRENKEKIARKSPLLFSSKMEFLYGHVDAA